MRTGPTPTIVGGRYELRERLARDATVLRWRALDTVLERTVVLELVHPELTDDPAFAERLAAGSSALAHVTDPAFARLLDTGVDDGVTYLVREHVEGRTLADALEAGDRFEPTEVVRIAGAVLRAVAEAHRAGVVLVSVRPRDVLLASDGSVRVAAVGIAPACAASTRQDLTRLMGEPLAPELGHGGEPEDRTDVWCVAALAETLFGGEEARIPRRLREALSAALSPDPSDRPTVEGFARELALAEPPTAPAPGARGATRAASVFRTWLAVPLLVVAFAAATVAVGLWMGRLELGGPVGIRLSEPDENPEPPSTRSLPVASVATLDPFGDGAENDDAAPLAADGDLGTVWKSENYFDGELNKPGVGLVLDLGRPRTVESLRLFTPWSGFPYSVAVGDDPGELIDLATGSFVARDGAREDLSPARGRYVLLWITGVVTVDDGNRAEVAELRVMGTD